MKGVSRCSVLLGAFSYLQYHRHYHLVYLFVTIDVFHEEFASLGTLLVCLVHDGTQSWGNESGGVSIGESDDGNILWDDSLYLSLADVLNGEYEIRINSLISIRMGGAGWNQYERHLFYTQDGTKKAICLQSVAKQH